jgi:hypothetical protein
MIAIAARKRGNEAHALLADRVTRDVASARRSAR